MRPLAKFLHSRPVTSWFSASFLLGLIFSLLFSSGNCRDIRSGGGAVNPRSIPSSSLPFFTSKPETYQAKVRDSVELACHVENLGESTVIWKEKGRIISAGDAIIRKDARLSLRGYNLRIDRLRETDAGEYVCEIETFGSPLAQSSTLEILVPPSVQPQPSDGKFVVRKGSTITLECEAKGNPPPKITWQRTNNLLPSGEKTAEGRSIVIHNVNRHHSGVYSCTASNKVGEPATAHIDLKVLYPPEIEVDQSWLRTKEGVEAEVSCSVHSEPRSEVKWYKDTMLLDQTSDRRMETFGNRHVLILRRVRETDFGNYSCFAENSLGRQRGYIDVSGRPHAAKIVSPSLGYYKDQYNLTWTVDSFLPIKEYRILYREFVQPNYQQQQHRRPKDSGYAPETEWTNIIPTIDDRQIHQQQAHGSFNSNSFTFTGNFIFYGLKPTTEYEVIIQSRNREGWSDPNDIFRFRTRSRDYNPMELASHDQQGFSSRASTTSSTAKSSLFALLAIWLVIPALGLHRV